MERIAHYFPELSKQQYQQFEQLEELYKTWNAQINVISRKDIDASMKKHVLHALGIAKVQSFKSGAKGFGCRNGRRLSWDSSSHLVSQGEILSH